MPRDEGDFNESKDLVYGHSSSGSPGRQPPTPQKTYRSPARCRGARAPSDVGGDLSTLSLSPTSSLAVSSLAPSVSGASATSRRRYIWDDLAPGGDLEPEEGGGRGHLGDSFGSESLFSVAISSPSRASTAFSAADNPPSYRSRDADSVAYFSARAASASAAGSRSRLTASTISAGLDELDDVNSARSSRTASALQQQAAEVKARLKALKSELAAQNDLAKQLQADYTRAKASRTRQEEKARASWGSKLAAVREGHEEALRSQAALTEKVRKDVQQLQEKKAALEEKLKKIESERESAIEAAAAESKRARKRLVTQWEADEAQATAKLVASKVESMHRAAAQALAPELERVVQEGQDALARREAEADEARRKLTETLRMDSESRFAEHQKAARLRYSDTDTDRRTGMMVDAKLSELRNRHKLERQSAQERCLKELANLEEEFDASLRHVLENHRAVDKSIAEARVNRVRETTATQARELSLITEQLAREREGLTTSLEAERSRQAALRRDALGKLERDLEARAEVDRKMKIESGLAEIISKMHQEVESEREASRRRAEAELSELRSTWQERLAEAEAKELKMEELVESLRRDLDVMQIEEMDLRRGLDSEKKALDQTAQRIATAKLMGRSSAASSSSSSSSGERSSSPPPSPLYRSASKGAIMSMRSPPKPAQRSSRVEADVQELKGLVAAASERLQLIKEKTAENESKLRSSAKAHADRVKQVAMNNESELRTIRSKVALVTRRRQEAVAVLRAELLQLQGEARDLQASIDQSREASMKMR